MRLFTAERLLLGDMAELAIREGLTDFGDLAFRFLEEAGACDAGLLAQWRSATEKGAGGAHAAAFPLLQPSTTRHQTPIAPRKCFRVQRQPRKLAENAPLIRFVYVRLLHQYKHHQHTQQQQQRQQQSAIIS